MTSKWVNDDEWACTKHAPSMYMPASIPYCLLCRALRPPGMPVELRVVPQPVREPEEVVESDECALEGCSSKRRSNSKYCSRNCSNKNARKRYIKRKSV